MKNSFIRLVGCALTLALFSVACKKDSNGSSKPSYLIPETYNFSGADSLTAKTTLSMLGEMENKISLGNNVGVQVSSATLESMFANQGNYFTDTVFNNTTLDLNASGFALKNAIDADAQTLVMSILDSVEIASSTGQIASNGIAGVSPRMTLLSSTGIYWRELFTKTMMGVLIGHQIADVYLGDSLNSNISTTARLHAWDQAFYLWCVPGNFPTNRAGVKYWGSYTSQIDSGIARPVTNLTGINSNITLMKAFLKGRAALSNNDNATALQQAAIIIPAFEIMEAAAASHELNEAQGNLVNGAAAVCGNLSASIGFWTALRFNGHKNISDADYQAVLALYGTNFYTITAEGIQAIQDKISSIYGWDAIKANM